VTSISGQEIIVAGKSRFFGLGFTGLAFCIGLLLLQPAGAVGPPPLPPPITVLPSSGPFAGGNRVVVTNISFNVTITNVTLSGVAAVDFAAPGADWFWFVAPATGLAGVKDIILQTSDDGELPLEDVYTVNPMGAIFEGGAGVAPASGSWTGGYPVVISGSNLGDGSDITNVTLCGVTAVIHPGQSATQVVAVAQAAGIGQITPGDVCVYSTSFGVTVASNAFAYMRGRQPLLVFSPASPQAYLSTNVLSVSGGAGTGVVSYAVLDGPGVIVDGTRLAVTGGSGTIWVRAAKAQDDFYSEAVVTSAVQAARAAQVIKFDSIADQNLTNLVGLAATADSGLPVSFAVVAGGPAVISGDTNLAFTGEGEVGIVASQAGDANWSAAPDVTDTFAVLVQFGLAIQSAHGTAAPATGTCFYAEGSVLTNAVTGLDAGDTTQFVCTGWAMVGNEPAVGFTNIMTLALTNNATLTWLWRTNYWLGMAAGSNGTVNVGDGWQKAGEPVLITATADPHYHFILWAGDADGNVSPLSLLMDAPKTVRADFAANLTTNNGTPEWWLAGYYPDTNDYENAAVSDTDGDGCSAWQEWVALTSPTNGRDCLRIEKFSCPSGLVDSYALDFISRTNRLYRIDAATNLLAPEWTPVTGDIEGSEGLYTVTLAPESDSMVYRLNVRLKPMR